MVGLAFGTGSMAPTTNLTNPPYTGNHFQGSLIFRIFIVSLLDEGHITSFNFHSISLVRFRTITSKFQTEAFPVDVGQGGP